MVLKIEEYMRIYGEIKEIDFERLRTDAVRTINNYTTGVDGIKKLKEAFPADEDDVSAVTSCAYKIINLMHGYEEAEKAARAASGYEATENGVRGKVITSVSSGSESISYSSGGGNSTIFDKAITDALYWKTVLRDTVKEYLSGVKDANGVNLLYMGPYPGRYLC